MKRWVVKEKIGEEEKKMLGVEDALVAQLLWNRGIQDADAAQRFLSPSYEVQVHSPFLFVRMKEAVARVYSALEAQEKIVVHGDYDADGICGATLLYDVLRSLARYRGGDERLIDVFLPDREKDGYGLARHTVENLAASGAKLIITVDCGISNKESIARADELGVGVIVCDHHAIPEHIPEHAILIHPQLADEAYPNKQLCGTGVASKLGAALLEEGRVRGLPIPLGAEKWLLDLVAIATVTDVVPLVGENRALEHFGLTVLSKTRRVGLKKLLEVANLSRADLDTWNIGFQIGPRINASGRIGHARTSFELLASENDLEASVRAAEVQRLNSQRQKESDALFEKVCAHLEPVGSKSILIAAGVGWHHGLIGLVAGKVTSTYARPAIVASQTGQKFVASGRSVPGFSLTDALAKAAPHLHKFGGHPQACGFTVIGEENFLHASRLFEECAREVLAGADLTPMLTIDAEVSLDQISLATHKGIQTLAPFGEGNPKPFFISRGLEVVSAVPVGNGGGHARLVLADPKTGKREQAIAFRMGNRLEELSLGAMIDVVFEMTRNDWNGMERVQMRIEDFRNSRE